ncbi:MAG TPA: nitroreductase family deazaflavin-dependent oxidoreductase [Anaerolineales bacterium]|nr:nitroreductase family deazaflavin-dependent oxidoreductase [Anaerolineales bacterium]
MTLTQKKPSPFLRAMLRAPIWLYRWKLGWLMGGRFLMLTHIGRKSGLSRQTVIEVVTHDETTGAYYVSAAWREKADWYLNIQKNPNVKVQVRNKVFDARAEQVSVEEAVSRLWAYAQRYPFAFRELVEVMLGENLPPTQETCQHLAQSVPVIALKPVQ